MKHLIGLGIILFLFSCQTNNKQSDQAKDATADGQLQSGAHHKLPAAAEAFIKQYFKGTSIKDVEEKQFGDPDQIRYGVELSDGTGVDFDKDGQWVEVSMPNDRQVPKEIIPKAIQSYLDTNHPHISVVILYKDDAGYEVELANDTDLYFDLNGKNLPDAP